MKGKKGDFSMLRGAFIAVMIVLAMFYIMSHYFGKGNKKFESQMDCAGLDTDGDHVPDGIDACCKTPEGKSDSVDRSGCAEGDVREACSCMIT